VRIAEWLLAAVAVTALPLDLLAQSEGGAYRTTSGGQEIATEAYRWSGKTLDATVDVPLAGHRVVTRTVYDDAFEPVSYDLRVIALATGAEQQVVHVAFGDSVRWTLEGHGGGAVGLERPRALMQNLLWSHLAAMARRLPAAGDATLTLHTFLVDNAMVIEVAFARHGGRLTATSLAAGTSTEVELALAADGSLDSAAVPSQRLVVRRVSADSVSASRPLVTHAPVPPPAGVVEEPFNWSDGAQQLAGTLTRPENVRGRLPVALIIAGSGPTDRDGNSRLGFRMDVYKKLAWALAQRGIASVRYDKRGIGASAFSGDPSAVTFDDYTNDAAAGARALAADTRFSKLVLVGHSEGALLAERAANLGVPAAGVAMLAGMGRSFTAVLHEQMAQQLDAVRLAAYDSLMALYLGSGPMPDVPDDLRTLLRPSVRRFVQTESALDPAAEARRLPVPLLVVQGATDIQVSVQDAEALHAARPDAEVHVIPDANHLFVHIATRDRAAQLVTYNDPTLPLVPELVSVLTAFVERVTR
jgi:pimeloyl-ACP methyl ester carboxylesterase